MTDTPSPKGRIQTFATTAARVLRVAIAAWGTLGVVFCMLILVWVAFIIPTGAASADQSFFIMLAALLKIAFSFLAMRQLRRFFVRLQAGEIFDRSGIDVLWRVGAYCLPYGVVAVTVRIWRMAESDYSFLPGISGYTVMVAEFLPSITPWVVGAVLILFSWLLREGANIEEENRLTI